MYVCFCVLDVIFEKKNNKFKIIEIICNDFISFVI